MESMSLLESESKPKSLCCGDEWMTESETGLEHSTKDVKKVLYTSAACSKTGVQLYTTAVMQPSSKPTSRPRNR